MPRRPSDVQLRALRFIHERDQSNLPFTCTQFAEYLWDTSTWERHTVGKTAGSYLWRLVAMRLVDTEGGRYRLTDEGLRRVGLLPPNSLG